MLKGFEGGYILNEALLFDEQVNNMNMANKKRHQYIGQGGETLWTEYYEWDSDYQPKYQLGRKLLNEYV